MSLTSPRSHASPAEGDYLFVAAVVVPLTRRFTTVIRLPHSRLRCPSGFLCGELGERPPVIGLLIGRMRPERQEADEGKDLPGNFDLPLRALIPKSRQIGP